MATNRPTPLARCEISTGTGQCSRAARWHLDCHGCSSGNICTPHLQEWQRRTTRQIGRDGGPCTACGQVFDSVEAAGTVTRLSAESPAAEQPATATVPDSPACDLLARYETYMRGAGRSDRWIRESLRTLGNLAQQAAATLDEIQPENVSAFLASPKLAPGSRATYFRQVSSFYTWWAKSGGRNPTAELPRPREPRGEPRPLSTTQVQQLLATNMRRRTRAMILLAALAGLRVHEIAKVRGEDIDQAGAVLHVTGKGCVSATIPLHPLLVDVAATMPTHGYWFPGHPARPGRPILGKSVSHTISLACQRAGIADGTAHRLRHWYGTTLLHSGADARTVQTLLRHASLTTTQRYTLVTDERRNRAIANLTIAPPTE